ncbi:hypothetical protein [Acuticoccus sp.]|uniref:hypothetical protein n=1 Tax=Acuticoccus sp. TaxID=1904378 RepID=UPI003B51BD2D
MYLIGLITQAAVLGAVVVAALVYEAPLRHRLGLEAPAADVDARLAQLSARIDVLADAVARQGAANERVTADLAGIGEAIGTSADDEPALERRLRVLERLVARVESKVDDVRDAQLFPAQGEGEDGERRGTSPR